MSLFTFDGDVKSAVGYFANQIKHRHKREKPWLDVAKAERLAEQRRVAATELEGSGQPSKQSAKFQPSVDDDEFLSSLGLACAADKRALGRAVCLVRV